MRHQLPVAVEIIPSFFTPTLINVYITLQDSNYLLFQLRNNAENKCHITSPLAWCKQLFWAVTHQHMQLKEAELLREIMFYASYPKLQNNQQWSEFSATLPPPFFSSSFFLKHMFSTDQTALNSGCLCSHAVTAHTTVLTDSILCPASLFLFVCVSVLL